MYFMSYCDDLAPIINLLKAVVGLIQFGIPIMLILFGIMDLGKAVMSSKEDEMKKAQGILIKRFIYAVAVFLIVWIVMLVMNIVADNANKDASADSPDSWYECWSSN